MILILKTGSAIESVKVKYGDFEDQFAEKMKLSKQEYCVYFADNYENIPPELSYSGIIITGSPLMVTNLELKSSKLADWLLDKQDKEIPILGICFGYQLLNVINGGSVKNNKSGIIIGSKTVYLTKSGEKDVLFGTLPATFDAFKNHNQFVYELPDSAEILCTNSSKIIDAIRFAPKSWGVQFHLELNLNIMNLCIENIRGRLISEGFNIDELLKDVAIFDYGEKMLKRFKEIINDA